MVFRSDRGAAFTSKLMRQVSNAMGVQGWDLSAPDNPTHHSGVERRNRVMEHFLDVGISKGDITCAAALERYCAAATAACNLEYQFNGHTVFEYVTGSLPRTHNNVIVRPVVDDVPLHDLDQTFIESLRSVLSTRIDSARLLRDDTARSASLRRSISSTESQAAIPLSTSAPMIWYPTMARPMFFYSTQGLHPRPQCDQRFVLPMTQQRHHSKFSTLRCAPWQPTVHNTCSLLTWTLRPK